MEDDQKSVWWRNPVKPQPYSEWSDEKLYGYVMMLEGFISSSSDDLTRDKYQVRLDLARKVLDQRETPGENRPMIEFKTESVSSSEDDHIHSNGMDPSS